VDLANREVNFARSIERLPNSVRARARPHAVILRQVRRLHLEQAAEPGLLQGRPVAELVTDLNFSSNLFDRTAGKQP
jgi:hypothetical protein